MRILVVSYYSLWSSSVGSRRMNGLISALDADGHEVTVLAARPDRQQPASLPKSVTSIATPPTDRVISGRRLVGHLRRPMVPSDGPSIAADPRAPALRAAVRSWISFPDTMWEWSWVSRRQVAGHDIHPDLVIASAPPLAALHAAAAIATRHGCPWIADMRDLWTGDPYRSTPRPLRRLDASLERRVLQTASAITTVAEPLADSLRTKFANTPITPLRSGFDPSWLRHGDELPADPPRFVYTGTLSANRGHDIMALCSAVGRLRASGQGITPGVDVFGVVENSLVAEVSRHPAAPHINFHGVVSASVARAAQHAACGLLSFAWEDPRDYASCPAKLFEYAAARRPILHLGRIETLGTRLIQSHGLGSIVDPTDADAVSAAVASFASGAWLPPSIGDLQPLSQQAMNDGFRRVIESVTG